jgi:hypothetical protein
MVRIGADWCGLLRVAQKMGERRWKKAERNLKPSNLERRVLGVWGQERQGISVFAEIGRDR